MMCIMHDGYPYGHLAIAGNAVDPRGISRMVGESLRAVVALLAELERANVFSRDPNGTIYSRRMVRDERLRKSRAEGGRQGGGYGVLGGRPKNPFDDDGRGFLKPLEGQQNNPPAVCSLQSALLREPSVLSSKPPDPEPEPPPEKNHAKTAEKAALERLWNRYLQATDRDSRLLTFSPLRQRKGLARLRECLEKTGGDLAAAEALMELAIERIAASDWHMGRKPETGGKRYCEWEDHLFPSAEKLEKWLADEHAGGQR